MMRVYNLKKPEDIVELAKYVQTQVYWGNRFCDISRDFNSNEYTKYRYFWEICESHMTERYDHVVIRDEVVLFKRGK